MSLKTSSTTDCLSILSKTTHLPYLSQLKEKALAASLWLSNFEISNSHQFNLDGKLHLYTQEDFLAGVRGLPGETEVLGVSCGRLEPLAFFPEETTLRTQNFDSAIAFLRDVLTKTALVKHLSTPVFPSDIFTQNVLHACGFKMIDTILGFHYDLQRLPPIEHDPRIREASRADIIQLSNLAHKSFADGHYNINRFNSDPKFEPDKVGSLYGSWVTAAVADGRADLTLVFDDGGICGFMTFKLPSDKDRKAGLNLGKAVLSAVDPSSQRQGIYKKLLLSGFNWMSEQGVDFVEGKTQLSTVPVIRTWQKLGAELAIVYHTFHN